MSVEESEEAAGWCSISAGNNFGHSSPVRVPATHLVSAGMEHTDIEEHDA